MTQRTDEMARAYIEEGLTYGQIGERYGITRQRVGQLLGPLELARDRGQAKIAREQRLRASHARLQSGTVTLAEEAENLGYASAESLRSAFYELGLRYSAPAKPVPEHGTIARYRSRIHGCRCEECRRANAEHQNRLRGEEPPNHGTYSGYINYGCRCKACKEAHRATVRARRATKRQRREVKV